MERERERDGEMERDGERRWTNKPLEANHRISIGFTTVSALEVLSKGNSVVVRVVELDVCEDLREYNISRDFPFFSFHYSFFFWYYSQMRVSSLYPNASRGNAHSRLVHEASIPRASHRRSGLWRDASPCRL